MAGASGAVAETSEEVFERLCLTLEYATHLKRDEAFPLLRDAAKGLERGSPIAVWYLKRALAVLGEELDDIVASME